MLGKDVRREGEFQDVVNWVSLSVKFRIREFLSHSHCVHLVKQGRTDMG